MRRFALLLLLAGCSHAQHASPAPAPVPAVVSAAAHPGVDASAQLTTVSEEVALSVAGRRFGGTLVHPDHGTWPAVLLLAGSGPTDRNWNSPLLKGTNGAGRLIAEELAKHGAVVLRFDKSGVGSNPGPPLAQKSFDTMRDEGVAALDALIARPEVDKTEVFVAGHSEGGIEATRVTQVRGAAVAGVIYLSAAPRSERDMMLGQVEANLRDVAKMEPAALATQMAKLRQAFDDFGAGKPVDPKQVSDIPELQGFVAQVVSPRGGALVRRLIFFDPSNEAAKLPGPFLVLNGGHDAQINFEKDAPVLVNALHGAGHEVSFHVSAEANHVLKHETRTLAELAVDPAGAIAVYSAPEVGLDADAMSALVAWLAAHTGAHRAAR